ncbi:MAG: lactonase family protein, partial [Verrucomicrobiales bacterium]
MKIKIREIAAGLMVAGLALPGQAAPVTVYFGTSGGETKGIYRAHFDPATGKLSKADLAAEIGTPGFLALHPAGDRLYAVANFEGGPGVAGFRVAADGSLSLINTSPIGDGAGTHIAVHPSGRFLVTAQYGGGSVALFPLEPGGRLGPAQLSRHEGGSGVVPNRQDKPHPHWCGFSPDGRFVLVPDLGLDKIVVYRVDAQAPAIIRHGFIEANPGGGPRHMRFSVDGKFIYLLNEISLEVTTFSWDAQNGTAAKLSSVAALLEAVKAKEASNSAAEILVHPNGRFIYSSNRGHDSVTA